MMNHNINFSSIRPKVIGLLVIGCLLYQAIAATPVQAGQPRQWEDIVASSAPVGGCSIFPANNIWNAPINNLPVHAHSDQWVNSIGRNTGFHMDFGSGTWDGGPIGIPYNVVGASVPKVPVSFYYAGESDPGPYPIPANPLIEHGSDHHILIVDNSACILYELYDASYSGGAWHAGSGAVWNLNSNTLRPDMWTSADAAGLPILPGLVRYGEILSGQINHAIRFTASNTNGYIWPARHLTSNDPSAPQIPPMGARFRLKASFNISGYPPAMQIILTAMKTYGIILADNGSDWYVSGAPDEGWDNDMLHLLDDLTGNDFEAVDASGLMVDYDSGATGSNISGNAGLAGTTLSYTDGTTKTATSQADGSYSFIVSDNWSGTVTPSHPCFTFTPASLTYSNVTSNQTAQNYTATFNPASGCANINVEIGGVDRGTYAIPAQGSHRVTYALDTGPVKVESTNNIPIIAALRDAWPVNGQVTSFAQLMGLPKESLSDTYYLPAYNNVTLSEQIRFANVDTVPTTVTVKIAGVVRGSYPLNPNEGLRIPYNLDTGPVEVKSSGGVKIIAAIRSAWLQNGQAISFTQLMGLPKESLSDTYYLPAYNNVTLSGQLRIGNVGSGPTDVTVKIAGVEPPDGPYHLNVNESVRLTYALDTGPVEVKSSGGVKIIVALRDAWLVNNQVKSFAQLMGLPKEKLSDTYLFPAYNNVTLSGQLRFGNVDTSATTVTVKIGGAVQGTYPLNASQSTRQTYNLDTGPIEIKSSNGVKLIAALRDAWLVNGQATSFVQLMGLPKEALSTTYWFPAYNNLTLSGQLRFGVP